MKERIGWTEYVLAFTYILYSIRKDVRKDEGFGLEERKRTCLLGRECVCVCILYVSCGVLTMF